MASINLRLPSHWLCVQKERGGLILEIWNSQRQSADDRMPRHRRTIFKRFRPHATLIERCGRTTAVDSPSADGHLEEVSLGFGNRRRFFVPIHSTKISRNHTHTLRVQTDRWRTTPTAVCLRLRFGGPNRLVKIEPSRGDAKRYTVSPGRVRPVEASFHLSSTQIASL